MRFGPSPGALRAHPAASAPVLERAPPRDAAMRPAFLDERVKLHQQIINEFNLSLLEKVTREDLRARIGDYVAGYVRDEKLPLNQRDLESFIEDILDEMTGLGPLEPLLKDPTVADILINTHEHVFVERFGQLEKTAVQFKDEAHLLRIVNKIVAGVGRRIDESSPMVDARLADGSRVNVAVRPVAVDGPLVSIRKFSKRPFSLDSLVAAGSLRQPMADVLSAAVRGRFSLVVSGGTGSGKTTMLNALSTSIPASERLVTIEDAAELQLQQQHVLRMETRPPNAEGRGEIRMRELVKNALRMRPDRIIVGECRGEEAFDMLQAMNTGHEGSMTTIHANTPRDALTRLEQMIGMASVPMTQASIRGQIAAAIHLFVQLARMPDGKRRVVSVAEVTGMEGEVIQMQEIFKFVKQSRDEAGVIHGQHFATGIRPRLAGELAAMGVTFPAATFDPGRPL
ncbi:MAG: type secretion system protein [Hyphomicrobiales bacterium]|nr:type secretion system protein [Hyphomicrobiales bacterium]